MKSAKKASPNRQRKRLRLLPKLPRKRPRSRRRPSRKQSRRRRLPKRRFRKKAAAKKAVAKKAAPKKAARKEGAGQKSGKEGRPRKKRRRKPRQKSSPRKAAAKKARRKRPRQKSRKEGRKEGPPLVTKSNGNRGRSSVRRPARGFTLSSLREPASPQPARHFSNNWISASAYSSADFPALPEKPARRGVSLAVARGHGDELHQIECDFVAVLRASLPLSPAAVCPSHR